MELIRSAQELIVVLQVIKDILITLQLQIWKTIKPADFLNSDVFLQIKLMICELVRIIRRPAVLFCIKTNKFTHTHTCHMVPVDHEDQSHIWYHGLTDICPFLWHLPHQIVAPVPPRVPADLSFLFLRPLRWVDLVQRNDGRMIAIKYSSMSCQWKQKLLSDLSWTEGKIRISYLQNLTEL